MERKEKEQNVCTYTLLGRMDPHAVTLERDEGYWVLPRGEGLGDNGESWRDDLKW